MRDIAKRPRLQKEQITTQQIKVNPQKSATDPDVVVRRGSGPEKTDQY